VIYYYNEYLTIINSDIFVADHISQKITCHFTWLVDSNIINQYSIRINVEDISKHRQKW